MGKRIYTRRRTIVLINNAVRNGRFEEIGSNLHGFSSLTEARAPHAYCSDMTSMSGSMLKGSIMAMATKRLRGITDTPSTKNRIGHFHPQVARKRRKVSVAWAKTRQFIA